jgi:hypothetical protein
MKRYRITRRADGAVICWVQPSAGDRYALPFAPVFSRRLPFVSARPAYASLPGTGQDHLAGALLADHLGPDKFRLLRFRPGYLQAFRVQFFVEQDPLRTIMTSLEIDAWRLSWQAQQPKPRRCRSSR